MPVIQGAGSVSKKEEKKDDLLTKREKDLFYHKITGNESIGDIAGMYGMDPQTLLAENPTLLGTPPAGAFLKMPPPKPIGGGVTANALPYGNMGQLVGAGVGVNWPPPMPDVLGKLNLFPNGIPGASPEGTPFLERAGLSTGNTSNFSLVDALGRAGYAAGKFASQFLPAYQPTQPSQYAPRTNVGALPAGALPAGAVTDGKKDTRSLAAAPPPQETTREYIARMNEKNIATMIGLKEDKLSLAVQDFAITGAIATEYLPTFISAYEGSQMNATIYSSLAKPQSEGGYGGIWNPVTFGWDLPSTAPGAKLTPGMSFVKAFDHYGDTGEIDLNVLPFIFRDDEMQAYDTVFKWDTKDFKSMGGVRIELADGTGAWMFPRSNNKPDAVFSPTGAPDGSGGGSGGNIYRRKGGGGGGGEQIPYTPASNQPFVKGPQTPTFAPETLKMLEKILAREHSYTPNQTIEQLEWFLASGALTPEQTILVQNELERLKTARDLALATSFGSSSSIWRIG